MKKLNKLLIITVFSALFISLLTLTSINASEQGICGDSLTWTLKADGTLVISGTGDMYDYTRNESPWYSVRESVYYLDIGEGVSSIGNYAFADCGFHSSVIVPDNVTRIGEGAFSGCCYLDELTIPFVGERAKTSADTYQYPFGYIFGTHQCHYDERTIQAYYCESTDKITRTEYYIPKSLKSVVVTGGEILKGAFDECKSVTKVVLGDSVMGIGDYAFDGCRSLRSIGLGAGITRIGNCSFRACSSLNITEIPDGITSIGEYAFMNCTALKQVYVPDSVTDIGDGVFYGCGNMFVNFNCGSTAFYHEWGKVNRGWSCDNRTEGFVYNYDSTCTEDGTETATCEICGMQKTRTAEGTATGHRYTLYYSNKDATCTEDGTKTRSCAWCSNKETITDEGSALGHSYSYSRNNDATCTEDGSLTGSCVRCCETTTISDIGSARGHTEGEWQITKEPSYIAEGQKVKSCTVCNEILETESIPALIKEMTFTDVKPEHWYYEAVEYCFTQGMISGVGDDKFAPQTELSRAMLVRILWNMEGCPEPTENHFADIGTDRWYTDAVNWAAENGIVAGMDNEHFCPDASITREQLSAIVQRYSAYLGNDVSVRADLNKYTDADKISDWAYESLEWTVSVGIISGRSETLLTPKGTATRAETVQIIYLFMKIN